MGMRPGNVGMDHLGPFWMNFRKTSEGGEGVVSHQKGFVAVFLVTLRGKNYEFSGKEGGGGVGVGVGGGGGGGGGGGHSNGSETVWKFFENSSKMVQESSL